MIWEERMMNEKQWVRARIALARAGMRVLLVFSETADFLVRLIRRCIVGQKEA